MTEPSSILTHRPSSQGTRLIRPPNRATIEHELMRARITLLQLLAHNRNLRSPKALTDLGRFSSEHARRRKGGIHFPDSFGSVQLVLQETDSHLLTCAEGVF
jgi:hypothetical protein